MKLKHHSKHEPLRDISNKNNKNPWCFVCIVEPTAVIIFNHYNMILLWQLGVYIYYGTSAIIIIRHLP